MNVGGSISEAPQPFWQRGYVWMILAAFSVLPFCVITVLPMQDLENHVGRFYVFLNLHDSEFLQKFYSLHWRLIGNLGVDVLVRALGPQLGAEAAARVVVAFIPPLTVAGIYAVSRTVNGNVTPSTLLSISMVYNWPFITGFVNFSLASAIALLVFALWIRLRDLSLGFRLLIFAPLAFVTWVAHTAGWGLLGLIVLTYEFSRIRSGDFSLPRVVNACFQTLPFAIIILFVLYWRVGTSSGVAIAADSDLFDSKVRSLESIWRERYEYWDLCCGAVYVLLTYGLYRYGGRRLVAINVWVFCAIATAFILCPHEVFKSGFADRRLLPYAVMFLPLAIGVAPEVLANARQRKGMNAIACIALAYFVCRILVSCYAWHEESRLSEKHLDILNHVPVRSRIFGLVVEGCAAQWKRLGRPDHLQQYALPRRDSMINGMFQNPGLNQVEALYASASGFDANMLAVVKDERCPVPYIRETLQSAMRQFPRDRFDYVWIIREAPTGDFDTRQLRQIAVLGDDSLYKVLD